MRSKIINSHQKPNKNPFDAYFVKSKHKNSGKDSNTRGFNSVTHTKREARLAEKAKRLTKIGNFTDFRHKNKIRKKSKSAFNLSDEDESAEMCKSLSQIECFHRDTDDFNQISPQNDEILQTKSKCARLEQIIRKSKLNNVQKRQMNDKRADFLDELNLEWRQVGSATKSQFNHHPNSQQKTNFGHKTVDYDTLLKKLKSIPPKTVVSSSEINVDPPPKEVSRKAGNVESIKRLIMQSADALDDDGDFYHEYEQISNLHHQASKKPSKKISKYVLFLECLLTVEQVVNSLVSSAVICQLVKDDQTFVPQLIGALTKILEMFTVRGEQGIFLGDFDNLPCEFVEVPRGTLEKVRTSTLNDDLRLQILYTVVSQGLFIVEMYSHLSVFPEIFDRLKLSALEVLNIPDLPSIITKSLRKLLITYDHISVNKLKVPLLFPPKKVEPIRQLVPVVKKTLEPKVKEKTDPTVDKRIQRSMLREMRLNSACQARLQLQDVISADKERMRKTKEIEKLLANQEGDYKASKRSRLAIE